MVKEVGNNVAIEISSISAWALTLPRKRPRNRPRPGTLQCNEEDSNLGTAGDRSKDAHVRSIDSSVGLTDLHI